MQLCANTGGGSIFEHKATRGLNRDWTSVGRRVSRTICSVNRDEKTGVLGQ